MGARNLPLSAKEVPEPVQIHPLESLGTPAELLNVGHQAVGVPSEARANWLDYSVRFEPRIERIAAASRKLWRDSSSSIVSASSAMVSAADQKAF